MKTVDRLDDGSHRTSCKYDCFTDSLCNMWLTFLRYEGGWLWRFPVFRCIIPNLKGSSYSEARL